MPISVPSTQAAEAGVPPKIVSEGDSPLNSKEEEK